MTSISGILSPLGRGLRRELSRTLKVRGEIAERIIVELIHED